ncbi:MAG: SpoIIE family protein phosphatase [Prevotella sp.]|nr:SpoIIE family protein phosphatase [Prevotella sp.]
MKNNGKIRSFAKRLTKRLVLTLLVILGLASFLVFVLGGSFVFADESYRHEAILEVSVENISRVASDVYVGTRNHVPEIEESLGNPDRMMKVVERVITQNPRIRSCGISFVENYYPQKGRCYRPYAVRRDSSNIEIRNLAAEGQDYLQEERFLQALQSEDGLWSEPFFENPPQNPHQNPPQPSQREGAEREGAEREGVVGNDSVVPLIAFLQPIRDKQGRTVAVLESDLSLDWLQEKMESRDWKIFADEWGTKEKEKRAKRWKPYTFLITNKGTFIVHPDKKRIARDNFSSLVKASPDSVELGKIGREMMGAWKTRNVQEDDLPEVVEIDGRDSYVFHMPLKHTGWSMALVVPQLSLELIAYVVGGVLVFLILLSLFVVWLVSHFSIKRATKPLKQLAFSADEVAKGNFDASLPNIKHNDEIRLLRDSFEDMQQSLKDYVEELKTATASKAAMENELKVAHDIQMSMLPKIFPPYPERKDIDIYGLLNPAKDVGGDLFDFYIHDNNLFFCIGDVSGKGVPASLVMAVTRSLFRNVSAHTSEPCQIVAALNEALAEGNDTNMFVTIFVGMLDLGTGILRYCNAGHDAPMLIGQGVGFLPCDANLPLGVMSGTTFKTQEASIESQTTIFLYTDGLNEAEDVNHVQFGIERVKDLAEKMLSEGENKPNLIVKKMSDAVQAYSDGAEQSDDLTMLAIMFMKE